MVWFYQTLLPGDLNLYAALSIPLWSDFIIWVGFQMSYRVCKLSIPLWSDFILRSWSFVGLVNDGLSIPLWSDFISNFSRTDFTGNFELSIPLWSDFIRVRSSSQSYVLRLLSIPLWSDFILAKISILAQKNPPFNPTMVWFYLEHWLRDCWEAEYFQSHYGLILSLLSRFRRS